MTPLWAVAIGALAGAVTVVFAVTWLTTWADRRLPGLIDLTHLTDDEEASCDRC